MTIDAKRMGSRWTMTRILQFETMYLSNNNITAGDDGIHSGDLVIDSEGLHRQNSTEGLEGKSITINGGDISIYSTDDRVNAANKTPNRMKSSSL